MNADTAFGEGRADFPSTLWTSILHAGDRDACQRRAAWEGLAKRYWKPIFAYVRMKWARSNEDAKDLTQEFFAWMMETGLPERADPGRGRFRVFVKVALDNYLRMDVRSRARQKRGGDRAILKFDVDSEDAQRFEVADQAGKTPEQILEATWKQELLARAIRVLKEWYYRKGKQKYFELFREFYLGEHAKIRHEDLAAKHGVSVTDVNNYLMDAKRTFRECIKDLLSETVEGPDQIGEEFQQLFGSLGS